MGEKSIALVYNLAIILNKLSRYLHLLIEILHPAKWIANLMHQETNILHLDPPSGIFVIRCPLFKDFFEMKGVDEPGVLFVGWAETFEHYGNEKVHHQKLDYDDENSKVYETYVSATLLRSISLHLFPCLRQLTSLSIKSTINIALPPNNLIWLYCQLSHNEIPILSRGTPY